MKGQFMGRMPMGRGLGPSGQCTCPKCGYSTSHSRGVPCYDMTCPRCGSNMSR